MLNIQLLNWTELMKIKRIIFESHGDKRGSLISLESFKNIPFEIKRVYYIFNTLDNVTRGLHAHKQLKQIMICVSGSCKLLLDDGKNKIHIELNNKNEGILIEDLIWREMYDFSEDCVLIVLANDYYDESDYIRDYNSFLALKK